MFTELLQAEVWRKKLEEAGFRVVPETWDPSPARPRPRPQDDRVRAKSPPP